MAEKSPIPRGGVIAIVAGAIVVVLLVVGGGVFLGTRAVGSLFATTASKSVALPANGSPAPTVTVFATATPLPSASSVDPSSPATPPTDTTVDPPTTSGTTPVAPSNPNTPIAVHPITPPIVVAQPPVLQSRAPFTKFTVTSGVSACGSKVNQFSITATWATTTPILITLSDSRGSFGPNGAKLASPSYYTWVVACGNSVTVTVSAPNGTGTTTLSLATGTG